MVGKTVSPKVAESRRMRELPKLGCVACAIEMQYRYAQVHHITTGSHRVRGGPLGTEHRYTIPLCPFHHVGEEGELTEEQGLALFGPSVHKHKRAFIDRYGSQMDLLDLTDLLLNDHDRERTIINYRKGHEID